MSQPTTPAPPGLRSRTATVHRLLAKLSWIVLVGGLVTNQIAEQASYRTGQAILLVTLAAFFPLLICRLLLAARLFRSRRVPLLLLAGAVGLWSMGSMVVNAASLDEQRDFPAPGEWFFLSSYLGLVGFLIFDAGWKRLRPSRSWLDAAVICGASFCLAALLLVLPVRLASGEEGLPLLLAVMYPLVDLLLALVVLGQALLRIRTDLRTTVMLGIGFALLACADSTFALTVTAPTYHFGTVSIALWGGAWALLVSAACQPTHPRVRTMPRSAGSQPLVGAGLVALAVLTLPTDETLTYYTVPPAVLTMLAVGYRMVLALRDANHATEALALSQTDDLTKLPNRRAVRARLQESLHRGRPLALMLLDLDGFKEINDALGHHAGDIVLTLVSERMQFTLENDVMVARLGGDEFAILVESRDKIELVETAHQLLKVIADPIVVDGIEISVSGSIGITAVEADDAELDSGEVLRRADVAMYQAKSSRSGAALYDAHLDEFSRSRLELAEDLRKGLTEGQIEVWYQPQVDVHTMTPYAFEALVRWRHPSHGLLSPIAFLPTARRVGLMGRLSDVIAVHAISDLTWLTEQGLDLRLALNCAPPELLSHAFLPRLYATLEEWQVDADRLILEVTEDSFLADPQRARDILLDARRRGLQISIDDYGTGFSSLTHLRNLPVQELKIDRSLVRDIATEERSRKIVASTIQLAHALDMRTVAEGVEDAHTMNVLIDLGIDCLQGYHLARPMPATELASWVRAWSVSAPAPRRSHESSPESPSESPSERRRER
jgi:diguanylate cyclase